MVTINRYLEHTNLKPTVTDLEIDLLVKEAKDHQLFGVCVPPFWVKRAAREIGDSDIALVTVVGFPLGYQMTEAKLEETKWALKDGANEIDVVMNISAFKSKLPWIKIELAKLANYIHNVGGMMKVILETAYLTDEEIVQAAMIAKDAGTDFVKTSTGFAGGGATIDHIKLLRQSMPSSIGIKASGGIKTLEQTINLIDAGADRIGTSSGVTIVRSAL